MTFHSFRDGNFRRHVSLWTRIWLWHDRHPLPAWLNRFVRRFVLRYLRLAVFRARHALDVRRSLRAGCDQFGDLVVPDRRILEPRFTFAPMPWDKATEWFFRVHEMNEFLRQSDGSWRPQPVANYSGKGIPIEDVALRILGYVAAHRAQGEALYLERAVAGSEYLLKKRRLGDGHLLLQGHTVIDWTYSVAGLAWLALHDVTGDERLLAAASRLGDHLLQYQVAGSTNHAAIPAQLLARLYRITGTERYLRGAIKRITWAVPPYQLPYGGWSSHESWTWYHAAITKSVVETYVPTPFTLEYQRHKDRMARCIYRALNRLVASQRADGSIKPGRGTLTYDERDEYGSDPREQWVVFIPSVGFQRSVPPVSHEFYCLELDALCHARLELPCPELDPVIEGVASCLASKKEVWRPEFNTVAAGAYLAYRQTALLELPQLKPTQGAR